MLTSSFFYTKNVSQSSMWVASGVTEAMINIKKGYGFTSNTGALIIREAGGVVTNIDNKEKERFDTNFASNKLLHDKIYEIIK